MLADFLLILCNSFLFYGSFPSKPDIRMVKIEKQKRGIFEEKKSKVWRTKGIKDMAQIVHLEEFCMMQGPV